MAMAIFKGVFFLVCLCSLKYNVIAKLSDGSKPWKRQRMVSMRDGDVCFFDNKVLGIMNFLPCMAEQNLPPSVLSAESSIIETDSLPDNHQLLPEIGNGHLATVVQSDTVYMNGLYNGAGINSHRARIPSFTALLVSVMSPFGNVSGTFRLDMSRGVFSEVFLCAGFSVEVRQYFHRELSRLMVAEIVVKRITSTETIIVSVHVNHGLNSNDISFVKHEGLWMGRTNTAEYPRIAGRSPVVVLFSSVPEFVNFPLKSLGRVVVLASASVNYQDALKYYKEVSKLSKRSDLKPKCLVAVTINRADVRDQCASIARLREGRLYSSHVRHWGLLWKEGNVQVNGNTGLALETTASLYYLYTAVPLKSDVIWPFVGMSPGGLAHGKSNTDYQGHVFWDQDTWMFPPLALLHAGIGRLIADARIRTLPIARHHANATGYSGSRFPWESAFTGGETSPSLHTTQYEVHVTGDISLMVQRYLQLSNDIEFLTHGGGYQLVKDNADFWVSRSTHNITTGAYEILGVMGPDEYHWPVNNSVYTNAIAVISMETACYAANLIGHPPNPVWRQISSNMKIPYDLKQKYHPEFDGYKQGTVIKQADVILLGYPLQLNILPTVWKNDLQYYSTVTPAGPAMTMGVFVVNWLLLGGSKRQADHDFLRSRLNIKGPFKVWSENADGTGAYNFHTGMASYLQALLFGYLGVSLGRDHMAVNPHLPANVSSMTVNGIDYLGSSIDVTYDNKVMTFVMTRSRSPVSLMLILKMEKKHLRLVLGQAIVSARQLVWICAKAP